MCDLESPHTRVGPGNPQPRTAQAGRGPAGASGAPAGAVLLPLSLVLQRLPPPQGIFRPQAKGGTARTQGVTGGHRSTGGHSRDTVGHRSTGGHRGTQRGTGGHGEAQGDTVGHRGTWGAQGGHSGEGPAALTQAGEESPGTVSLTPGFGGQRAGRAGRSSLNKGRTARGEGKSLPVTLRVPAAGNPSCPPACTLFS